MIVSAVYLKVDGAEITDMSLYTRSVMLIPMPVIIQNKQFHFWADGDVYLRAWARYSGKGKGGRGVVERNFTPWDITQIDTNSDKDTLKKLSRLTDLSKLDTCLVPIKLRGNFGSMNVLVPVGQVTELYRILNNVGVYDKTTVSVSRTDV